MKEIPITSFDNLQIGQAENTAAGTGCTVVLLGKDGAPAGLDVRGGGPASRESELLKPLAAAQVIHAIVLAGGSEDGVRLILVFDHGDDLRDQAVEAGIGAIGEAAQVVGQGKELARRIVRIFGTATGKVAPARTHIGQKDGVAHKGGIAHNIGCVCRGMPRGVD